MWYFLAYHFLECHLLALRCHDLKRSCLCHCGTTGTSPSCSSLLALPSRSPNSQCLWHYDTITGVADAEAYLQERLGNYEAALALHLAHLDTTNKRLDAAVMSGQLPLLQLPPWAVALGTQHGYSTLANGTSSSSSRGTKEQETYGGAPDAAVEGLQTLGAGIGALCEALLRLQQQNYHHHHQQQQQSAGQEGRSTDGSSSLDNNNSNQQQQQQQQQQPSHACEAVAAAVAGWLLQQLQGGSCRGNGAYRSYTRSPSGLRNAATRQQQQQQQAKGLGHSSSSSSREKRVAGHAGLIAAGQKQRRAMTQSAGSEDQRTHSGLHRDASASNGSATAGAAASAAAAAGCGGGIGGSNHSVVRVNQSALAASFMEQQLLGAVRLCHVGWVVSLSPHTQLKGAMDGAGAEGAAAAAAAVGGGGAGNGSSISGSNGLVLSPPAAAGEIGLRAV
jgi:hypothetical protein